jgi:hypothetical protein
MQSIATIGLDIAKSVFQVHGVDAAGQVVLRRQLKRRYVLTFFEKLTPCLVGIEACASSHHWSRELQALGHSVRLMPPAYYVKRQKNDVADAEAICEAATRANIAQRSFLVFLSLFLLAPSTCRPRSLGSISSVVLKCHRVPAWLITHLQPYISASRCHRSAICAHQIHNDRRTETAW